MPAARIVVHHHFELHAIVAHTIAEQGAGCSLNHLDVGRIEFFDALFKNSPFNGDISEWNTSRAISMSQMFHASAFNGDISKWDTGRVLSMPLMFADSAFNQSLANWNVANVTDFHGAFRCSAFDADISKWDTGRVQTMRNMFMGSVFHGDVSGWNTMNVKCMDNMFVDNPQARDFSRWDFSNVDNVANVVPVALLAKSPHPCVLHWWHGFNNTSVFGDNSAWHEHFLRTQRMTQALGMQDQKECALAMQRAWVNERYGAVVEAFPLPPLE